MSQPLPLNLSFLQTRYPHRVAGILRQAWPVAVLAGVGLLLWSGPEYLIHGVALPAILIVSVLLSLACWWLVDTFERRLGGAWAAGLALVIGTAAVALGGDLALRRLGVAGVNSTYLSVLAAVAVVAGAYARWAFGRRNLAIQVVALTAIASSAAELDLSLLVRPWRDAKLYMDAARAFNSHAPVYLAAPMTSVPKDWSTLPYLYPPFTLPFFGALARLPHALGVYVLVALCAMSVVAGLRLLGVPWRMLPPLLIWPPFAIGVQVGNVACIGFLLLAAAWRVGMAAPLAGIFKAQSGVVSLWLIRERRWRSLLLGAAGVAIVIVATLPLTGIAAYGAWLQALDYFQVSVRHFPTIMGLAIQRFQPAIVAIALAVGAIVVGLLAGGRDGLARLGIAAVVASPTVYIHGLAFGLPAILMLDAATAWGLIAIAPWGMGGWWALGIPFAALVLGLTRQRIATRSPSDAAAPSRQPGTADPAGARDPDALPFDADVHPLGGRLEPWPDPIPSRRTVGSLVTD